MRETDMTGTTTSTESSAGTTGDPVSGSCLLARYEAKRAQLEAYRDELAEREDGLSSTHAATICFGRLMQIEQDIEFLKELIAATKLADHQLALSEPQEASA